MDDTERMNAICQVLRDYGHAVMSQELGWEDDPPVFEADYAQRIIDALVPDAKAEALEDAASRVRAVENLPKGYTVDPASLLDDLAEGQRDRMKP